MKLTHEINREVRQARINNIAKRIINRIGEKQLTNVQIKKIAEVPRISPVLKSVNYGL